MAEDREYLQQLALYCLHRAGEAQTAAFLAEYMAELALSEGHGKLHLTANQVLGILRSLERAGVVMKGDGTHSTRHGRAEPTWRPVLGWDSRFQLPEPPELDVQPAPGASAQDPYPYMTREQLIALLHVHDDINTRIAEFRSALRSFEADMAELAAGARSRMAKLGVE